MSAPRVTWYPIDSRNGSKAAAIPARSAGGRSPEGSVGSAGMLASVRVVYVDVDDSAGAGVVTLDRGATEEEGAPVSAEQAPRSISRARAAIARLNIDETVAAPGRLHGGRCQRPLADPRISSWRDHIHRIGSRN